MIEGNLINLADMNELFTKIEIYNNKKILNIFSFFYLISKYKPNEYYLFLLIKFIFFFQILNFILLCIFLFY